MADIYYDKSDKRKYHRLSVPISVKIHGLEYKALDWSVNAIKIADYNGNLQAGNEIIFTIGLNFQGFIVEFVQKVKVLRIDNANKTLVAEYIEVSQRNKEILSYFTRGIITGEFQAFDDIIKHIDVPYTDETIDMRFSDVSSSNKKRKNKKFLILNYIILGFMVVFYIVNLIYSRAYLLPIESAVVTSNIEEIKSPVHGVLTEVYTANVPNVTKGTPLFKVVNPDYQRQIEEKRIQILKNKALLKEKELVLQNNAQTAQVAFLKDEFSKKQQLYRKKMVSKPEIDNLQSKILGLEQEIAQMQVDKVKLEDIIAIEEQDLAFSESINHQNTVIAPFDAVIIENRAYKGKYVDDKTPLMLIRQKVSPKYIQAYLTTQQANKIVLYSRVYIEIPLYNVKIRGTLTDIQMKENAIAATIVPESQTELNKINIGTPVKISFIRHSPLHFGLNPHE